MAGGIKDCAPVLVTYFRASCEVKGIQYIILRTGVMERGMQNIWAGKNPISCLANVYI